MEEEINGIKASEQELNSLFKEVLDGVRDDILETQVNVELYFDAISNENGGKEMYGINYNDALKIKGMARDRQLKFLNMFKDRVSKKEQLKVVTEAEAKKEAAQTGLTFNHSDLNKFIEEAENRKSIKVSAEDYIDDEFDEDDDE